MLFFAKIILCAALLPAALFMGCASRDPMKAERSQLIARLNGEMRNQTGWLRIHAAEALLDNRESAGIVELFQSEADTAAAPYRIGVWRILARSTSGEERIRYIERIRAVLRNPQASDRVSAAESLGKLDAAVQSDREIISHWLLTADDATAVFPRWLLELLNDGDDGEANEGALAKFLTSPDAVARLRAGFVMGRLKTISPNLITALHNQLDAEPVDSVARIYLITALLLHFKDAPTVASLKKQLLPYLRGKANEQLEASIVIGLIGQKEGLISLRPLLDDPEPDARIGAANGMLQLLK
jgi:HEAT repeat protein